MDSTIKLNDQFQLLRAGENEMFYLENSCLLCGWVGQQHYAHNDYQHSNCSEERERHVKLCSALKHREA